MTIKELKEKGLIILECISGSKAYGLDTPSSDTDIKGVYLLPKKDFYSCNYIPQVSNPSNDIVYYELGRYMELLSVNNPNILELLNTPPSAILYKHPFLEAIHSELILSKLCKNTFGKFALSQIKKAKGLKKKIVNPIDKKRKSILSFCYVNYEQGSIPLLKYLQLNNLQQDNCGLTNIPHMKNVYGLFHNKNIAYSGIIKNELSNDISLSSIPKGEKQKALLYFNKDGYSVYCKEYKEYWKWVENRNETR
ncbi:MAG TPA: nucleotidyltransferase, partial [Saprospiraceae bacterium]|nr:nucleotidyltransferase [Saprospiraceae bacterium]